MSRILNVASALLFVMGIYGVFSGGWHLSFLGNVGEIESMVLERAEVGKTVSEIRAFSPNLLDFIGLRIQFYGLLTLSIGLFICVISLIPFKKGEKWAWYAMLVIGGINVFGMLILTYIGMPSDLPTAIIYFILWIVGLALPAKEILSKPS